MQKPLLTVENTLWGLILVLALGIRLLNLGADPLSESEAGWALQALSLFPGSSHIETIPPGPQPLYIAVTGFLFGVMGDSDALARALPALAGGLLCLAPYFFRKRVGNTAALIMGVGLALDPGLVTVSRLAGGPMLALSFLLLGLGMLVSGRDILAGCLFGLAILSGPAAWHGALILALTAIAVRLFERLGLIGGRNDAVDEVDSVFTSTAYSLKALLAAFVATVLLVGTFFSFFPQGLGALGGSIPAYLAGWVTASDVSAIQLLLVFLVYQPLAFIFGSLGAVRSWVEGNLAAQRLSVWVLIALIVGLLYPSRQVGDLVWVLVPLWGLASIELARYFKISSQHRTLVFVQAVIVFLMLGLFWLNIAGISQSLVNDQAYLLRIGVLLGVLALIGLTTILLGFGWSWSAATQGLVLGSVAALGIYQIAGLWNSSQNTSTQLFTIWNPSPQTGENRILIKTVQDFSNWSTGTKDSIDLVVAVNSPSLRWTFRHYPNASFISEQQPMTLMGSPGIVITRVSEQTPVLSASYRGQDLAWWRYRGWEGALPQGLLSWIAYRKNPASLEQVILWARADLFPNGSIPSTDQLDSSIAPGIPLEADTPE